MRTRRAMGALALGTLVVGVLREGRRRHLRFGATPDEVGADLPGDDLIARPGLTATRAVTIAAPPQDVWPWLVQIGQQGAGFYSYEALENLFGCDIHNADRVVPEWQGTAVGDEVRLFPDGGLTVAAIEHDRALVLDGGVAVGEQPSPFSFTWAFVLRGRPDGSTRLVVRERYGYLTRWAPLLVEPVQLASFVMTQKMLRGIRERAERR